ncbi:hypothetical protein RUND412_004957 [Rhizina undulata]
MDTIPTEILHEILSYMPEKDLGSVRLLNHFFNTAANDRYFRTIRVPFTNASIQNLLHLSHQPHVARCVQHLIYPNRLDTSSMHMPPGEEAHEQRRSHYDVPQEFFDTIKLALSKMPNIREITANFNGRELKLEDDDEWPESSIIRDSNFYITDRTISDENLWANAFKELLADLSQAQTRLDKLTMHSICCGILTDEVDGAVWKYTPLFQNLTSLTVFFCTFESGYDLWDDVYGGRIFKFLSSAPKLKKLSLGLDWQEDTFEDVCPIPLAKLFGRNYVWEHLEAFYFNGGEGCMNAKELMHFWARHSPTLKTFGLYYPQLKTGTWREVFDCIKEKPGLCLENIIILEPLEDSECFRRIYRRGDYRKKINEYVIRGGPPFPPTEAELEELGLDDYYEEEYDVESVYDDEDDAPIQLTNMDDIDDYYDDEYELEDPEYDSEF